MQIKHSSKKKKIIIISFIVATIMAIGSYSAYALFIQKKSDDTASIPAATSDEQKAGDQVKQAIVDNDAGNSSSKGSDSNSSSPSPSPSTVSLRITASSQNGDTYQIRTLIESIVSNGTCTLTLTQDSKVVTKKASIQALAQTSTCQGFDVPLSELTTGVWNVKIALSGNNISGNTTGTINVQ